MRDVGSRSGSRPGPETVGCVYGPRVWGARACEMDATTTVLGGRGRPGGTVETVDDGGGRCRRSLAPPKTPIRKPGDVGDRMQPPCAGRSGVRRAWKEEGHGGLRGHGRASPQPCLPPTGRRAPTHIRAKKKKKKT